MGLGRSRTSTILVMVSITITMLSVPCYSKVTDINRELAVMMNPFSLILFLALHFVSSDGFFRALSVSSLALELSVLVVIDDFIGPMNPVFVVAVGK